MNKSFWDRIQELKESINGGVEPMDEVHLRTKLVKIALGMYLFQSVIIALWWSIRGSAFGPWLIPIISFLQVGWFWNKVTDSWKVARGCVYQRMDTSVESSTQSFYQPPTINIQNAPITEKARTIQVQLDTTSARESVIDIDDPLRSNPIFGDNE